MNNSFKQNKARIRSVKEKYERKKDNTDRHSRTTESSGFTFEKIPLDEIEKTRKDIRSKWKTKNRKEVLVFSLALIVSVLMLVFFYNWLID